MKNDLTKTEFDELLDLCSDWEDGRHVFAVGLVLDDITYAQRLDLKTCTCGRTVKKRTRAT